MGDNTHKKLGRRSNIGRRIAILSLAVAMVVTGSMPSFAAVSASDSNTVPNNPSTTTVEENSSAEAASVPEEIVDETTPEVSPQVNNGRTSTEGTDGAVTEQEVVIPEESTEEKSVVDDIEFTASQSDYLSYDPLYILKYANPDYVNVTEMDMRTFYDIKTVAKGVATYNIEKQKNFDVTEKNYIAGLTYQMPVYDVDAKSDYYVAIPNVNKFNTNFKAYDLMLTYDNDFGEKIPGWKYEKGILYIPKTAIDSPTNEYDVPEDVPIGVQLNYAIGGDMDFSKTIPVQVLDGSEPINATAHADNIFDVTTLSFDTGVTGRKESDISVYLNGSLIPITDDTWTYDRSSGTMDIIVAPGVVSNVNVIFNDRDVLAKAGDALASMVNFAIPSVNAVSADDMKVFKTGGGKPITLNINRSDIFVGWRGFYNGKYDHGNWNQATMDRLEKHKGFDNSFKYMYGGSSSVGGNPDNWSKTEKEKGLAACWAFSSYALDYDIGVKTSAGKLGVDEQVKHWNTKTDSYETKTIYEWILNYRNSYELTKSRSEQSLSNGNGIGGYTNFAFALPKKIQGADVSLVSAGEDRGRENKTLKIESDELEAAQGSGDNNTCYDYWICASCNHLDEQSGSIEEDAGNAAIFVTCLGVGDDYAILAFVQSADKYDQNACGIYKFKIQPTAKVKVKKTSNNSVIDGNNCYSVEGAEFGVYDTQAKAAAATDTSRGEPLAVLKTKANGETDESKPLDRDKTYYVKELKAPKGHYLNTAVGSVTLSGDQEVFTVTMFDPPVVGTVDTLLKKVIHTPEGDAYHGDYDLSHGQFTVKYYDNLDGNNSGSPKRTWVLETDEKGELKLNDKTIRISGDALYTDGNGNQVWPIGTYSFEEKTPPAGFVKNTKVFKGTLKPVSGYQTNPNKPAPKWQMLNSDSIEIESVLPQEAKVNGPIWVKENSTHADLIVRKVDRGTGKAEPEGDGSFDKTVFSVINVSTQDGKGRMIVDSHKNFIAYGEEVCKITTNAEGVATTKGMGASGKGLLQCGEGFKYKLVEVTPPEGYLNDDWTTTVELKQADENKVVEAPIKRDEPVIRGGVKIHKDDNDLADEGLEGKDKPQGDATLAGAEFTIVNKSKKSVVVRKVDYLSNTSPTVNWRDVYHYPTLELDKNTKEVQPGEVVGVIRTDAKGDAATLANDLPYGTYEITETKASPGYKIDTTWFVRFEVRKEGVIVDKTIPHVEEPVIRGGVKIQKWDRELDKSEALGGKDHDATNHEGPDLNNIKFTIKNVSGHSVVTPKDIDASIKGTKAPTDIDYSPKKGKFADERLQEVKSGDVVGIMTTSWNEEDKAYEAWTQTDALPYGTYEVWESRTNKYYELTDKHVATFQIREDGTFVVDKNGKQTSKRDKVFFVTKDKSGNNLVWKDYAWRQGFEMTKIFDSNSNRGGYIPFKVTNLTTGEYHYVVTDANGYMNTEKIKHSQNTNAYDEMIDKAIAEGKTLTQADFKKMRLSEDGVDVTTPGYWFYLGEDGTKAPVDDNKAALPYGKYQIEEIKVDINQNYGMQKFDFWVNQDEDKSYDTNYQVVNLDTITNDEIEIKTTATDAATESHEGTISEETTIVDEVEYKGLIAHKKYTMKGTLMKKVVNEDGTITSTPLMTTVTKEDGTTEEVEVTAEKEFEAAAGGTGTVALEFKFNASDLGGSTVVAFEDLYQENTKLATHADIKDKNQTVFFPDIRTLALDEQSGTHVITRNKNIIGKEKATVVDTVMYSALVPGDKYTVKGTLMKVVTNEDGTVDVMPLKDKNGNAVTAEDEFKAEAENGSFDLKFTFESEGVETAKIVVYEELYKNGKPVAEHKDPKDQGQTVYLPEIKTSAADPNSQTEMGILAENATIVDTVTYKNHAPGEYIMRGTLMDKVTGEPVKGADGKDITAEQKFTVSEGQSDGTVEMTFSLDSTKLVNPSLVVFEKDYLITGRSDSETPDEGGDTSKTEILVAEHEDINDIDQTVEYPNPHYDMYKVRTTPAPLKGDSDKYGFRPGDTVLYDVVVKNTGNVDITVDVSDEFEDSAKEYFTEPTVKEVKNADVVTEEATKADDAKEETKADEAKSEEAKTEEVKAEAEKSNNEDEKAADVDQAVDAAKTIDTTDESKAANVNDAEKISKIAKDVTAITEAAATEASTEKTTDLSGKGLNRVTITVKAGQTATVVYESQVKFGAKEYLAPAEADSDSLDADGNDCNKDVQANKPDDKDGYVNTAKADNPRYPNPGKPGELIPVPEGPKDDIAQTPVQELSIHTTATDADSGEHVGLVRNEVKIKDEVQYESLKPGKTYTLVGTLMDKATGKPVVAGADAEKMKNKGKDSTGTDGSSTTKTVDADAAKNLKPVGTATAIDKTVNVYNWGALANYLKATGYVSYDLFIADADKITSEAIGKTFMNSGLAGIFLGSDNSLKIQMSTGEQLPIFTDSIEPGQEGSFYGIQFVPSFNAAGEDAYALATIHVKNNGSEAAHMGNCTIVSIDRHLEDTTKTITDEGNKTDGTADTKTETGAQNSGAVTTTKTFTADNANGSVEIEFAFSGVDMSNKTVVAFEKLYEGDKVDESKLIATHEDINDDDQSVYYPTIDTKASYKDGIITDTVNYTNLVPGMEYELSGILMDKKSGNSMEITAMKKFTPKEANGSVDMTFEIDASKHAGKSIVVFETLKLNGKVVAEHHDINDKDQTVTIEKAKTPVKDSKNSKDGKNSDSADRASYKTGDFLPYILTGVLLVLAAAIAVVYRRRRQE